MGDFNFPNIDWQHQIGDSDSKEFIEAVQDSFLFQFIDSPTTGNNILDLVLSNNEQMINNVEIGEQLGNSDHKSIYFNIQWTGKAKENTTLIPDFRKANYGGLRRALTH